MPHGPRRRQTFQQKLKYWGKFSGCDRASKNILKTYLRNLQKNI